ncbi:MAG: insulinase family protein [Acidobacteria bacterium]|jgi:predicted Zn-dependent peptidase|nr:insulinase family protein [Acidobacteriota bacterium]
MKARLFFCFLAAQVVSLSAQSLTISSFELPNGLKVILAPSSGTQAAAVCVYHMRGARQEPVDGRGISYLYQYLMFDGNRNLEPFDHVLFINKLGGVVSGRVNYDNAVFYDMLPAQEIKLALWLESERLKSLRLNDANIDYHKNQIYARLNRLLETSQSFKAQTWVSTKVFEGSAYELPLYGDLGKLRSLSNDRIRENYQYFQNLGNILLIIAGKFDANELRAGINEFFQNIPPGRRTANPVFSAQDQRKSHVSKNWVVPGLKKSFVVYGIKAPAKIGYNFMYFDFLRYYLTDPRSGRLEHVLNTVNSLDVEIESGFTDYMEANCLTIQISSAKRINLEKAKYVVEREFQALGGVPLGNNDLRAVRSLMEIDFLKGMVALDDRCVRIGEFYHMFNELNFFDVQLRRLRRITSYDILESAKKYLLKENQVILNVYGE